jgi:hypothetical protein
VSASIFDRRRSERFAQLLDEGKGRRRHHREADLYGEMPELVKLAGHLSDSRGDEQSQPDAEFQAGLRAMLMAKIEREGIGVGAEAKAAQAARRAALAGRTQVVNQVRGGTGRTRAAVLIGVTTGALVLSGVSAASTDAQPGDPLYQVKLSTERAQLAFAGSDASRGQLYMEFARARASEAKNVRPDLLARVLSDMDNDTKQALIAIVGAVNAGADVATLGTMQEFVVQQLATLDGLPSDDQAVKASRDVLRRVQSRITLALDAINEGCGFNQSDDLGPQPKTC